MTFCTCLRTSTAFGAARKPNVTKVNGTKTCWLSIAHFRVWPLYLRPLLKQLALKWNLHSLNPLGWKSFEIQTTILISYPSKNQNIWRSKYWSSFQWTSQEVHGCYFLSRNPEPPKYIKRNIHNNILSTFKASELSTMYCMISNRV